MSVLGFKARVDFSLACFLAYTVILRSTSCAKPADCMEISMAASLFDPLLLSTSIGEGSGFETMTGRAASTAL